MCGLFASCDWAFTHVYGALSTAQSPLRISSSCANIFDIFVSVLNNLFSNRTRNVVVFHEPLHSRLHGLVEGGKLEVWEILSQFSIVCRLLELTVSLILRK